MSSLAPAGPQVREEGDRLGVPCRVIAVLREGRAVEKGADPGQTGWCGSGAPVCRPNPHLINGIRCRAEPRGDAVDIVAASGPGKEGPEQNPRLPANHL
jgi:hypothetical protein